MFFYTAPFFAYCRQLRSQRHEGDEPMSPSGPVKSERVPMDQAEMDKRLKRGVDTLRKGYGTEALRQRGFGEEEIRKVIRLAGMGKR